MIARITGMSEDVKRKDRPGDQPMPAPGRGPWIQDLVLEDLAVFPDPGGRAPLAAAIERRKEVGLARYGRLLQAFNDRDALRDACEEAVDLVIYLRQCLTEAAEEGREARRAHLAKVYYAALETARRLTWLYEVSWS